MKTSPKPLSVFGNPAPDPLIPLSPDCFGWQENQEEYFGKDSQVGMPFLSPLDKSFKSVTFLVTFWAEGACWDIFSLQERDGEFSFIL